MADTTMTTAPRKSVLVAIASRYSMEPAAFEQTVRATCGCANASREEFAAFLLVANEYQLNPLTREIYAFPRKGGGIVPIVSVDGWLSLANRHPQMDGYQVTFDHDDQGRLVSATCTLHRKDRSHPTVVTEYLAECVRATDPWKMAHRMLRHKATIQAIRCAFGFAGIMEPDEAETIIDVVPQAAPRIREAPALPAMTAAEFEKQAGTWASLVSSGKKTADDILALARTRWTLSPDQEDAILGLGQPVTVAADGEVIDEADRGDAWEPETASTEGAPMNLVNLKQGSPEWHAHRAKHFNASDAPAMLGCSPYQTRRDLLRRLATGIEPEVDTATAARFANGHRLEAIARPLAEEIVGEPLYALTGVSGRLSASFDGLTLGGERAWEHKALNDALRFVFERDEELPLHYRAQMEHQLIVSGADEVLFMASKADGDGTITEEFHRWYQSDPGLRQQILDGWSQFADDLAAYQPEDAPPPAPVGVSPETLPALRIEVEGTVIASNLAAFRETAITAIRAVNRSLATDQDFADAELSVKWCREVETRIEAAKAHALSQTASIDELFRTLDAIAEESRRVRLDLEREVKARKEEARAKIVAKAQQAIREHVGQVNRDLAPHALPVIPMPDLAGAIKGKRNLRQMEDAVDSLVAGHKIAADANARVIRANAATYERLAAGHEVLFPDLQAHIGKPADDFAELVQGRIARHQAAEEARRAREDAARAAREKADLEAAEAEAAARVERDRREAEERRAAVAKLDAVERPAPVPAVAEEPATLNLGDVCDRLGITMSAGFVRDMLGITPAATVRRSVMFTEGQFGVICGRLSIHARACATHWLIAKAIAGAATVRELGQIGDRIDMDESDGDLTEAHADALRAAIDRRHEEIEPRKEVTA